MRILLILPILMLTACDGDDESSNLVKEDLEPTQLSFTSKPTDAQVLSFLQKKGRFDIELSDNAGKNSTYQLRKRWQKGFAYKKNAKIEGNPDAILRVGGFVQFQINGQNYDFDVVKPLTNQILGLEPPEETELLTLINENRKMFYPSYYKIVDQEPKIKLPDNEEDRKLFWYSPLSFKIDFNMDLSEKSGNNSVEKKHCVKGIRFYRDEIESPFNRLLQEQTKCTTLESIQYSRIEYNNLATLESINKEKQAQQVFDNLVDLDIPDFKDEKDAMRFVYKTLYSADKETAKSLMMKMFADLAFIEGSHTQISGEGYRIMRLLNYSLFDAEVTFSQSFCPKMFLKKIDRGSGEFWDALKNSKFRISIQNSGGKLNRGKMVGEKYKIADLAISTVSRKNDIENLKSWPLDELCEETAKKIEVF